LLGLRKDEFLSAATSEPASATTSARTDEDCPGEDDCEDGDNETRVGLKGEEKTHPNGEDNHEFDDGAEHLVLSSVAVGFSF
jgi:hypothetical protein